MIENAPVMIADAQVIDAFTQIVRCREAKVSARIRGTIGDALRITSDRGDYCFKMRTRNSLLQYSPERLQEPLAYDALLQGCVRSLANLAPCQSGSVAAPARWLPDITFYKNDGGPIGIPWMITPWLSGGPLWQQPTEVLYMEAGSIAARIHTVGAFAACKCLSGGAADLIPAEDLGKQIMRDIECLAATFQLARATFERAIAAARRLTVALPAPTLVHNDFTGHNLLLDNGRILVIDWDNAGLWLPEIDLVKMFYWTSVDKNGLLAHCPPLFRAFLSGYRREWHRNSFHLCRLLWLLRVGTFELRRETEVATTDTDTHRFMPFPRHTHYRGLIEEWLNESMEDR